jgi:uncharacterized protein (TIGR00725 family)
MAKKIIGVMGGGEDATEEACKHAYRLGQLVAERGWILLTGGRNIGVMDAAPAGAKSRGGLTIGILGDKDTERASANCDICIVTGIGDARNNINVLSSDVVIACEGSLGTITEVSFALINNKPVILLDFDLGEIYDEIVERIAGRQLFKVSSPEQAIEIAEQLINSHT